MRKFLLGAILFFSIILIIVAIFFTGITLVKAWQPWCIIILSALGSGIPLWHRWTSITGSEKPVWNYLFNTVVAAAVFGGGFFLTNYIFSDHGSKHPVEAIVVSKYSREQAKRRTVGRRVIYTAEKYHTYHILLRFDNGLEKEQPVEVSRYLRIRQGDKITYNVERGLFGIRVIKL